MSIMILTGGQAVNQELTLKSVEQNIAPAIVVSQCAPNPQNLTSGNGTHDLQTYYRLGSFV